MSDIIARAGGGPEAQGARSLDPWTERNWLDINRSSVTIIAEYTAPAVADTVIALTKSINGISAAPSNTIGVTAGRILRLTGGWYSIRSTAAAIPFGTVTLREDPTGAAITTASVTWGKMSCHNPLAAFGSDKAVWSWPEGIEFSGAQVIGISASAQAVTNLVAFALFGFEYTPPA